MSEQSLGLKLGAECEASQRLLQTRLELGAQAHGLLGQAHGVVRQPESGEPQASELEVMLCSVHHRRVAS